MKNIIHSFLLLFLCLSLQSQDKHKFEFSGTDFLLDGKPFQIIGGEMHPARIPHEYWRQRIQMAKAMGCNTISAYLFWNYYERTPGVFDFSSENRNIAEFIKIVREEGMWLIIRPGPYACAEWDFGGLPAYLLKDPAANIRCMDPGYIKNAVKYMDAISPFIKAGMWSHGGPILMVQIENEYGSYGNDMNYLRFLKHYWEQKGIEGPFYTADGASQEMLDAGSIDSCAIGLNSGSSLADFAEAFKKNPRVPSLSAETYPGWLTHWGEKLAEVKIRNIVSEVRFLMDNKKSFVLYMIHGGTNFGFSAGANSGGKGYEPDITSYDYDAPISEQGRATQKYDSLRLLISKYTGRLLPIPDPVQSTSFPSVKMQVFTSAWNHMPAAVRSVQPRPMEAYDQYQGFVLYRTKLTGVKSGRLNVTELHDFGLVYINSDFLGTMDRRLAEQSLQIPITKNKIPQLDIFIEAMGHINYAQEMIDRKGITERASLNGMTLMNWEVYNLPFDSGYIQNLRATPVDTAKRLVFFRGSFVLNKIADSWLDLSGYKKGMVWVNGHNLGRYWDIGPQKKLYCPASWLKAGENVILVFDLLQSQPRDIAGYAMPTQ